MTSAPSSPLTIRAGRRARARLMDRGFEPDLFSTLVGASGGPKWLVISQLDRLLVDRFLVGRRSPIDMIGSSIGCFRHACFAQADPGAAIARFEAGYVEQAYSSEPDPDEVSAVSRNLVELLLGESGQQEILSNAKLRNHMVVARMRGFEGDGGLGFKGVLALAALLNGVARRNLGLLFERIVMTTNVESAPRFSDLPTRCAVLCRDSVADAILASGTIPMVMRVPVRVGDLPAGAYLDGGLIDYHFDFRFETRPGLTLFPHFFDRIIPGWLDKPLAWRRVRRTALEDVVMLAPSPAFIASLPGGRVPDRNDFERFDTATRVTRWREVVDRCAALPKAFADLLRSGDWQGVVQDFR